MIKIHQKFQLLFVCWVLLPLLLSELLLSTAWPLDLEAGLQQPFDGLIIQNRQAMQSMGWLMDWPLVDIMIDSLFFCATLTATPHLHKQSGNARHQCGGGSRTRTVHGRVISGGWVPVPRMKVRSLVVLSNHSTFHWWSAQSAARMLLLSDELMSCCAAGTNGCLDLRRRAFASCAVNLFLTHLHNSKFNIE